MQKKTISNLIWIVLLSFPVLLLGKSNIDLSKRFSSIIYFLFCVSLLITVTNKVKYNIITKLLITLSLYILIDIVLKQSVILKNLTIRDFAEIIRIVGIIFSFSLGLTIYDKYADNIKPKKILLVLLLLQLILSIGFILKGPFQFLNFFYTNKSHRFSGLMPGINYIWVGVGITYLLLIEALVKKQISKNKKFIYLIVTISITAFETLLSVSFTSIIIFCLFTFTLLIATIKIRIQTIIAYIVASIITFIILSNLFSFIGQHSTYFISKLSQFNDFESGGSLNSFSSLQQRFEVWRYILSHYTRFPFTGYGSGKDIISYTDNTYIMSFFRYGILGLMLEVSLYVSLLIHFKKKLKKTKEKLFIFVLSFILSYLIAGLVSNVFYELRTPYVAFLLFGYYYNYEKNKNILSEYS